KITRCDEKIKDDVNSIADELLHFLESHKEIGIKFGIDFLDETIGGLYKGELTTIGAKSGVGKTALALQILRCCIKQGKKVLLISREMSRIQMLMRNISSKTGISTNKLKSKNIDSDEWGLIIRALGDLTDKNLLYINDDITTVSKIKRRLREVKPDLLIVDYLQLLTPEQNLGSREREVALLSRELKNITLDFDIPVIQLSQLNDEMKDIRPWGERPMRDSKAIYHDSNNVIYIHRPHGNDLYEAIENIGESKDNVLEAEKKGIFLVDIVVAKCRDGQTKFRHHCYNGGRLHFEKLIY
ncbi:MAG TPA: DnaB-like helicase C-terminal domain-containing protein, partial [Peptostreptococcaceae bacterium]|nr:DnaB-like helicase C-terminal domain-containing protein [Peptostreptococcaceae bacterium]